MPINLVEWKKCRNFAGEMNEGTESSLFSLPNDKEKHFISLSPMARGWIVRINNV